MAAIDGSKLASSGMFGERLRVILVGTALTVSAEAKPVGAEDSPEVERYYRRRNLSQRIYTRSGLDEMANLFAYIIGTNAAVQGFVAGKTETAFVAAGADAAIEAIVLAAWDAVAGV